MKKEFIPNYLTLGNIFCGFLSILTTMHGYYIWSSVFIFLAMLADRYDGIVARKMGVFSELGKELDSLCDVVSFGVAPAALIFEKFGSDGNFIVVILTALVCAIYSCCGAYRLARFNVTVAKMKKGVYQGVPITTCGTILAVLAFLPKTSAITTILIILTILCSFLMISTIKIKKI